MEKVIKLPELIEYHGWPMTPEENRLLTAEEKINEIIAYLEGREEKNETRI